MWLEGCMGSYYRCLTPEEVPALALAIERLEEIAGKGVLLHSEFAQTALDDIKAML